MTPEQWQQIKTVLAVALEVDDPGRRAAYLDEVCGTDRWMRDEVDRLLRADAMAGAQFLANSPLTDPSARGERQTDPLIGRRVGGYHILDLIGVGAMGEVYRARDTKLGREVALKLLPSEFVHDPDRIARFGREAQLLAALNHPHIGAIYGLEDNGGVPALVLELVEGETLADRIGRGLTSINEARPIARQIIDALEAAHEQGIIHRDLKPANVKITPKGNVKLLDFGLAKMTAEAAIGSRHTQSPAVAVTVAGTRDGRILGTAAYMSPEQALGQPVDARTDIWAFGCVLYELVTGRRPFAGSTVTETMAAILEREPDWQALPVGTPPDIREVLQRCLQKDVARRLQHIGDARAVIEEKHQEVDGGNRRQRQRRLVAVPWVSTALGGAIVALVVASWPMPALEPPLPIPFATEAEVQAMPRWSPAGDRIAYVAAVDSVLQVFVKSPGSAAPTQITRETTGSLNPMWSPDGTRIYYVTGTRPNNRLRSVAAAGGQSETVLDRVSQADVSPDGKTLAVLLHDAARRYRLAFSSPPGAAPRPYTQPPLIEFSNSGIATYFRFDPSGQFVGLSTVRAGQPEFWKIPMDGGPPQEMLRGIGGVGGRFTWSRHGNAIIGDAPWPSAADFHLSMMDWSAHRRRAITSGPTRETFPSLSPDGRTLAYTSGELGYDIIDVPLNGSVTRDLIATARRETAPAWAPDGLHFVYDTDRSGAPEIWLRNRIDGSERRIVDSAIVPEATQFTDSAISPDGTRLAYRARREPDWYGIWLSPLSGGAPVPLWNDQTRSPQRGPSWSPDGTWIAYYGIRDSKPAVMKVRVGANGPAEFITTMATYQPVRWSPRGDWIAFRDGQALKIVSPDGQYQRVISKRAWETYGWSKDGAALYGIASDANRRLVLATIDVETGHEHQIADIGTMPPAFDLAENFNEFPYRGFSLHPDGSSFLTSVLRAKMQIYLMKDFDRGGRLADHWWRRQ